MELTAKELLEHIKENGLTLATTTEDLPLRRISKGTKLWFGKHDYGNRISTWDRNTDKKNEEFDYGFDYEWSNFWHEDYKGKFIIEEPRDFKAGDIVRILDVQSIRETADDAEKSIGMTTTLDQSNAEHLNDANDACAILFNNKYEHNYQRNELGIVSREERKEFIIHCPTEQDWNDIVNKVTKEGYQWGNGAKISWYVYNRNTCIHLYSDNDVRCSEKAWYQKHCPNTPIISANEYLGEQVREESYTKVVEKYRQYGHHHIGGELGQTQPKQSNKFKHKFMSVIKNVFKSRKQKALDYFDISSNQGGLNDNGRRELVDYIFTTDEKLRESFLEKIVEEYKEEEKK